MRILLSGASGFIGAPLKSYLLSKNYTVFSLVRTFHSQKDAIFWNPYEKIIIKEQLEHFDAVIHLGGEPIASGVWTATKREKILESRTLTTQFLASTLSQLVHPPKVFLSASAVGFYGNRGEELLTEGSSSGTSFLSHVCSEWEKSTSEIETRGVRVAHLRFGSVLGPHGGILAKMIPFYRLGLGAKLGSGEQWMSWISLKDLIAAIDFVLHKELAGAINLVSPQPCRQLDFSKTLAELLHRPHFFALPSWLLHFFLGMMADEIFLSSLRVRPQKLLDSSFTFHYPDLLNALNFCLKEKI